MNFNSDVRYQKSHEWAKCQEDTVTVGISDYAQDSLGDIVFVEMPDIGAEFTKGEAFGVVESVKATSDVFVPVSGEILEVNSALADKPELINEDPFGKGWLVKIKAVNVDELEESLDSSAYEAYTKTIEA